MLFGFLFRFLNRQETADRFLTMYMHIVETAPLARRFRTCFHTSCTATETKPAVGYSQISHSEEQPGKK